MSDTPWWWMSFADPDLPEGSRFLGVAIVQVPHVAAALTRSHRLGINPGGEVQLAMVPEDLLWAIKPREFDRRLDASEAKALSARMDRCRASMCAAARSRAPRLFP